MATDAFKTKTMKRKNIRNLALAAPAAPAAPSAGDAQVPGSIGDNNNNNNNNNNDRGDTLEIGVEFRLDLRSEDLVVIKELGAGNGGTVSKVQHAATKVIMARKIIHVEAKKEVRKRIVRELQIMHECSYPNIVSFFGAFMNETGDVIMCMEYMDVGALDSISKNFGPVRVDVLGKIAEAVLGGLTYLYRTHRIMHRDIKPSNILVNSKGQIKLCDFGVSSELVGSVADTFVGTGTYMAPERIKGAQYTIHSDVWSFGLSLMELAIGKFPFSGNRDEGDDGEEGGGPQSILDLLQQIVMEPAPKLPKSDAFPLILEQIIEKCLIKEPKQRPTPQELYDDDPFIQAAKRTPVNLQEWAVSMMVQHNRKSHLIPAELSPNPSTLPRANNNNNNNAPYNGSSPSDSTSIQTPTSMDMDINMSSLTIDPNGGHTPRPSYPQRTSSNTNSNGMGLGLGFTQQQVQQPQQQQVQQKVVPQMNMGMGMGRVPTEGNGMFYRQPVPPQGPLPDLPRKHSAGY